MNIKNIVLVVVVVVAIAAAVIWYVVGQKPSAPAGLPEQAGQAPGVGADIYNKVAPTNPAAQVPDTNPLKANTNPYSGAYKNPFGQ